MAVRSKKPVARDVAPDFRWCPKREHYVAVSVCLKQASRSARCRTCYGKWVQLPLPFPETGKT